MTFWVNTNSSQSNSLVCILCNSFHSNFSFREILCCISHLPSLPFPKKSFQIPPLLISEKIINFATLSYACPFCICLTSNSLFQYLTESQKVWDWTVSTLQLKAGPIWTGCSWPRHKVACASPLYMMWQLLVSYEIIKATLGLNWAFIKMYLGVNFTGSIISLALSRNEYKLSFCLFT